MPSVASLSRPCLVMKVAFLPRGKKWPVGRFALSALPHYNSPVVVHGIMVDGSIGRVYQSRQGVDG